MVAQYTKRSLVTGAGAAGLGLGGLALLAPRALADTPFANFAFPATGTTNPRTMPDRLAEIKNVKDFGAVGDNIADDTAAIQAAVNWTSGPNRGTIYFPIGSYRVTAPITFNYNGNLSICFRGEVGTLISGNFAGYIFDRRLPSPNNSAGGRVFERLNIQNGNSSGGCIRIGSTTGAAIRDCLLNGYICVTTEDAVGQSSQNVSLENCVFSGPGTAGSHFVIIGGGGAIQACDLSGADTAVRAYGAGLHCSGNRSERNNTAWLLGLDSGGNNVGLSGFALTAGTTEGNLTAIDLAGTCSGFMIGGYLMMGHDSSNAAVASSMKGTQYGIRVRADCARNGVISGINIGSWADVAAFAIESASSRTNLLISNVNATQSGGAGVNWLLPTNGYTASFSNCNVSALWKFSQLPIGSNALEGDELDIIDSTTAAWGASVTSGGGSNRVRVRYNGKNWTVVGA